MNVFNPDLPQLAPVGTEGQWHQLLVGNGAPHRTSKVVPRHPAEETHFGHLYRFQSFPKI